MERTIYLIIYCETHCSCLGCRRIHTNKEDIYPCFHCLNTDRHVIPFSELIDPELLIKEKRKKMKVEWGI